MAFTDEEVRQMRINKEGEQDPDNNALLDYDYDSDIE